MSRSALAVYLLMLLLIGVGYLAIMPVFEGFDETAHFSSLREVADARRIPKYGKSYLDKEASKYHGPRNYDSLEPPFDRGLTYSKFFAQSDLVTDYLDEYRRATPRASYAAGEGLNWEAQHPPLYYVLMAPVTKITENVSFVAQIFWLRLASYGLALVGVAIGLLAAKRGSSLGGSAAVTGFLLYPLVFPMFFLEFTRIGNDSLCLFLTGLLAFLLPLWRKDKDSRKIALLIGVTLGFGLLTKAFFIPITAALVLFTVAPLVRKMGERDREALTFLWILAPALLIGAGWYAFKFAVYGDIIGSDDAIRLAQRGGLITNLRENGSIYGLLRGLTATAVSWSWAGTWSLTRLPPLIHMPLLILTAWVIAAFALEVRARPLADSLWLTVWLFLIFGSGFLYHAIESIAINGNGNTPGWYLHILMPWVAPAIGVSACSIWRQQRLRVVFIGLLVYAFLFQVMAVWSQFALFTGCAVKGDNKYFVYSGHAFCLDETPVLINRLAVLGWPVVAAIAFCGGLACAAFLVVQILRTKPIENSPYPATSSNSRNPPSVSSASKHSPP